MTVQNSKAQTQQILTAFHPKIKKYEEIYKHIHANPELSWCEKETAELVAKKLGEISPEIELKTGIGGYGLVGILKNGSGKTVLLRADMDALPVKEKTGLPYQSTKKMLDVNGVERPVMHACGHDFHITCLLAAAELLVHEREKWSGTCIFLFQVSEETVGGARKMVEDGLYDPKRHACPIPDVLLGQHVVPFRAGTVGVRPGPIMAANDSFRIVVHGSGGHGSMPDRTIDPIVIASSLVTRLQTIVSREVSPNETAVVTIGSFHAGSAPNIIPDEAELELNMRTYKTEVREKMIKAVERIVKAECAAGRSPKEPIIEQITYAPRLDNDPNVCNIVSESFADHFGDKFDPDTPPFPASEDFGELGNAVKKPYLFWFFGGFIVDEEGKKDDDDEHQKSNPPNHSPFFAPALEPSLKTGIQAMAIAALAAFNNDE